MDIYWLGTKLLDKLLLQVFFFQTQYDKLVDYDLILIMWLWLIDYILEIV